MVLAACLAVAVVAPYAQLLGARFINFDDPSYVTENAYVRQGLSGVSVRWALTATEMGSWHPLTWLSHLLDVELFGMNAGGHHATSVALHTVSTIALFLVLRRMTGRDGASALVAALFGLHPLHVESVAWISERKDVLSTLFLFLALAAYASYAARPDAWRYAAVVLLFALGLMSKPMLVSFPFLLLLLDVWPLGRMTRSTWARLVVEKLPLFAMTVAMALVTLRTQRGAMGSAEKYPLARRVANAALAYVTYLRKTLWPVDLSCFYPYPRTLAAWSVVSAVVLLAVVSVVVVRRAREQPYLFVGWFWFVGMLVPVIGLVQVGAQALADRYTYVPLIGVFIALVWGAAELAERRRVPLAWRGAAAVVVLAACMIATWRQVAYWRDSTTLFQHALAVDADNYMAYVQVGAQYDADGNVPEAMRYYETALRVKPDYAEAHNNLGLILAKQGDAAGAATHYDAALRAEPFYADAHYNRGLLLQRSGQLDEAVAEYRRALELRPSYASAHSNLGVILYARGELEGARAHLTAALRLQPTHVGARVNLGAVLRAQGDLDGAAAEYTQALRLDPRSPEAHYNLGNVLLQRGDRDGAVVHYEQALRLKPGYEAPRLRLREIGVVPSD
jgi:Tfp pilus assembly protein PilF